MTKKSLNQPFDKFIVKEHVVTFTCGQPGCRSLGAAIPVTQILAETFGWAKDL